MATSMRPYAESAAELASGERIGVPTAVVAPREGRPAPPRSWIERSYADLRSYRVRERGGHFLAAEDPERSWRSCARSSQRRAPSGATAPGRGRATREGRRA
jgi:hypothetical protein